MLALHRLHGGGVKGGPCSPAGEGPGELTSPSHYSASWGGGAPHSVLSSLLPLGAWGRSPSFWTPLGVGGLDGR